MTSCDHNSDTFTHFQISHIPRRVVGGVGNLYALRLSKKKKITYIIFVMEVWKKVKNSTYLSCQIVCIVIGNANHISIETDKYQPH